MIVSIIGLGLIGGSMALDLKEKGFASRILGVDSSAANAEAALKLGLADQLANIKTAAGLSDLIILAVPVNAIAELLPRVLDHAGDKTVVTDVGSTKQHILDRVKDHPRRKQFVASHPMSGTENSGPSAAIKDLFRDKVAIICNGEESHDWAVKSVEQMYRILESRILYMKASDHDEHVGYVSHLSHVISYALALAVLEKEKSTSTIFDLASGGFDTTVRLAKSSPDMWTPIFEQNASNILPILDTYISKLNLFRTYLEKQDYGKIYEFIKESNKIRKVLNRQQKGLVESGG